MIERWFTEVGEFFLMAWRVLVWTPRRPWAFGDLLQQMIRVGVLSLPVVLLTALFTGMVMALQTFGVLARVGAESFTGSIIALSMVRELSAVLGALMIAGRCGSAMGAEIGTMRVTQQIDALEVLATDPVHYLVVPRVWATTLVLPLLVGLSNVVGIWGGYLVSVVLMGANPVSFQHRVFQYMEVSDVTGGLIKAAVFGFVLALIGCFRGYRTRGGAKGVGDATTGAVVVASISILVLDFFLTKVLL